MAEHSMLGALRNGSLKTEERLKVACAVARYGDNPSLPGGKVTLLTRWICDEICRVYSKKGRSVFTSTSMREKKGRSLNITCCIIVQYPLQESCKQ